VVELPPDFDNQFKRMGMGGLLNTIKLTYNPGANAFSGMKSSKEGIKWTEYQIELGPLDGS
jgi:hypothetical protein